MQPGSAADSQQVNCIAPDAIPGFDMPFRGLLCADNKERACEANSGSSNPARQYCRSPDTEVDQYSDCRRLKESTVVTIRLNELLRLICLLLIQQAFVRCSTQQVDHDRHKRSRFLAQLHILFIVLAGLETNQRCSNEAQHTAHGRFK